MIRSFAALALGILLSFQSWGFIVPHQDPTDILILVNRNNKAPSVPLELVKPNVEPTKEGYAENIYMRPEAAQALEELFAGAAQAGQTLFATSGFRSYSVQNAIFQRKVEKTGESNPKSVAPPGYSEHQTGLAMDIEGATTKNTGLTEAFGESPEGLWVAEHCWEYGFIIRYPKDKIKITGYVYEPWHLRYIGREAAAQMHELGDITFEEYILLVRADRVRWLEEENVDELGA